MLYVAEDGNYGDSTGLVIVDNESLDEHFYNYLEYCSDWLRAGYAEWFSENDHDFMESEGLHAECIICEEWINDIKESQR